MAFAIQGDQVFPTLVTSLLPTGIRGLIVACLLAALMSSLASLFNSSAALFTVDVYEKLRPGKSQKHLLNVGRIATTVVVGVGMIWIPVMAKISDGGLYQYLQSVQGYLAPPITAVFLLGCSGNARTRPEPPGRWRRLRPRHDQAQPPVVLRQGRGQDQRSRVPRRHRRLQLPLRHRRADAHQRDRHGRGLADDPATHRGTDPRPHLRLDPPPRRGRNQGQLGLRQQADGRLILLLVGGMYLYFSFWLFPASRRS
jgi:hypothetical protein